jgi:hypothetical protein
MSLDDESLADVYEWVDELSPRLSATPRNCAHDFSDAVLVAEIIRLSFPKSVDLHNYPRTNTVTEKVQNWETLHRKVFKKMKVPFSKTQAKALARAVPGEVEIVLLSIMNRIKAIKDNHAAGGMLTTTKNGALAEEEQLKSFKKKEAAAKQAPALLTETHRYDVNGMKIKESGEHGPITSPETVEELMQMEKYHRLLIRKLKAEASHDYEQYAEAVASLDGFEDWVAKYQSQDDEDEGEDKQAILKATLNGTMAIGDRPKFMTTTRRETYFTKDSAKIKDSVQISASAMQFAKEKRAEEKGVQPGDIRDPEPQSTGQSTGPKEDYDFDLSATTRANKKGGARPAAEASSNQGADDAAERGDSATEQAGVPPLAPEQNASSSSAADGAADDADGAGELLPDGTRGFVTGSFVYLKNARFEAAKESTKNPRFWVACVDSLMPPSQYRLKWMKETKVGSCLFEPTPAQFIEAAAILKPITTMVYDEEAKKHRWDSVTVDMPDRNSRASSQ